MDLTCYILCKLCVYIKMFDLWHNVRNEYNDRQQGAPGVYQDFL